MQKELSEAMLGLIDKECEKAVIGALINHPSCYYEVGNILKAHIFTVPKYRAIFEAVSDMIFNGQPIDICTLVEYLIENPAKGVTVENWFYEVTEISQSVATSATVYSNASNLNDLWQRRQTLLCYYNAAADAADRTKDVTDTISKTTEKSQSISDNAITDIATIADAGNELEKDMIAQMDGNGAGAYTGIPAIDERGGYKPKHLIIHGAYPGQGKSALLQTTAIRVAVEGNPIAIYTMEMSKSELMARAIAADAGLNVSTILNSPKQLTQEEWQRFRTSKARLSGLPIYFNEKATTSIEDILCSARTFVRRNKIRGIFVDYLQIMGYY